MGVRSIRLTFGVPVIDLVKDRLHSLFRKSVSGRTRTTKVISFLRDYLKVCSTAFGVFGECGVGYSRRPLDHRDTVLACPPRLEPRFPVRRAASELDGR